MTLHEQNKQRNRDRILAAAETILREEGPERLSMRYLAEYAGVSLRTPYNLFGSKTDILAELLTRNSAEDLKVAHSPNEVAEIIQHIFAATEQTSEGTRSTSHMVRELSRTAEELKASVARFKIA